MALLKKNFYAPKRSEYRNNYLPFDYYDFWITAKENENLRFKNKLRDYLHTPFDWDEDQDYYVYKSHEQLNQSTQTQTTERPNRHDQLKELKQEQQNRADEKINNKKTKSTSIQTSPKVLQSQTTTVSKPRRARSAKTSKQTKNKIKFADETRQNSNLQKSKFSTSLSSMAVQTPVEWKLRDYKNNSRPTSRSNLRSSSLANFKEKRPPFANYGWACKTKDLSFKPTHNAHANKILADNHNENAVLELTLHKLKKEANAIANEFSLVESKVADRFQNFRSDSRAWSSEYDEKYADYSKSIQLQKTNPNRLTKSTLVSNYQPLRRGPRSAKKKIYYLQ